MTLDGLHLVNGAVGLRVEKVNRSPENVFVPPSPQKGVDDVNNGAPGVSHRLATEKRLFPFASRKRKKEKSDQKAAFFLIAPSMTLIFLVAVWPVMQSFYFSLFDLRLNDPSKSSVNSSYSIDLERYLNNAPFLLGALDQAVSEDETVAEELTAIKQQLQSLDETLQSDANVKEKYDAVNEKLINFENVSSDLQFVKVDKEMSAQYLETVEVIQNRLDELPEAQLPQKTKLVGLASGMNDAIVQPNFIGLRHYENNFSDPRMWKALWNTTFFTVVSVFCELLFGLGIALLLHKTFFGRGLVRATILIPWAVPTAVSALMWKFLYDGQNGVVAHIFEQVGLFGRMSDLLTTEAGAMFAVIFSDVWKTTPYMALLILAGLQTIPHTLYEAAGIDGAGRWKQFLMITLPMLKSSILVALLFRTLDAFRVFDLIFVLTGGGPGNATETISILAYKVMFSQTNFGEGSALSVIVFVCVAIISAIYIKILGKDLLSDGTAKS